MLGFSPEGRFSVGQISAPAPAVVTVIPSEVTPSLRGNRDRGYRIALAASGEVHPILPIVSFGWFGGLSEPVRKNPGLGAERQQILAFQPAPSPFVATGWYASLSLPVRVKPRSPAALSPFQSWQPAPSPFVATGWYAALSQPVRMKLGLKTALQQFLASPSRLLPTPTSFGVMSALETKDTFLAGAMSFNRPTDAEIAVINTTPQPAEIGLYQTGPTAGTITARISIVIG